MATVSGGDQACGIYVITNPDKLSRVGPKT